MPSNGRTTEAANWNQHAGSGHPENWSSSQVTPDLTSPSSKKNIRQGQPECQIHKEQTPCRKQGMETGHEIRVQQAITMRTNIPLYQEFPGLEPLLLTTDDDFADKLDEQRQQESTQVANPLPPPSPNCSRPAKNKIQRQDRTNKAMTTSRGKTPTRRQTGTTNAMHNTSKRLKLTPQLKHKTWRRVSKKGTRLSLNLSRA